MPFKSCRVVNVFICLGVIIVFITTENFWEGNALTSSTMAQSYHDSCVWTEGDPQLFHLKTSSGVHYDGGHWFHVAENFMVQHTLMRQRQKKTGVGLASSKDVYLSIDRDAFVGESNSMTRFMLGLGMTNGLFQYLHFVHAPRLGLSHTIAKPGDSMYIPYKSLSSHQVLHMDEPLQHRFDKLRPAITSSEAGQCMKFMGSVGGEWPTLQRGHWFSQPGDVTAFRDKMSALCGLRAGQARAVDIPGRKKKKFKMSVYQRDLSRVIANLEFEALPRLREKIPHFSEEWDVDIVTHDKHRTPCSLMERLFDTDVLLTAHGFQSMLLLFLPLPSLLFEVYPYKYFKQAYSPLSREFGVRHGNVMSPAVSNLNALLLHGLTTKTCMEYKYCRVFSRADDVLLTTYGSNQLIGSIDKYKLELEERQRTNARFVPSRLYNESSFN